MAPDPKPLIEIFVESVTAEFADGREDGPWETNWSHDWEQTSRGSTWCEHQWHGPASKPKPSSNEPVSLGSFILRKEAFGALAYHPLFPVFRLNDAGAACFKKIQAGVAPKVVAADLGLEEAAVSDFLKQLGAHGLWNA